MRRVISLSIIVIVLILGLSSCAPETPSTPSETPAPSTTLPSTTPPTATETPSTSPASTTPPSTEPTSTPNATEAELKVHFIDVGQGDAILIDLGDTEVLIDGGDRGSDVNSYLKNYVDGPLEVMIATHPHADHIGGLISVLAAFEVKEVWHNGDTSTSKTYSDFMSAVNSEGTQVFTAVRGNTIEADGIVLKVLHPVNLEDSTNNNSIVLYLAYGQVDFLFTGDAEKEAEGSMLIRSDMPVPEIEILKVGHHGSRTASSPDFLSVTTPETAIYMAGLDNRYGHPHQETITALTNIGAQIYGTDVHGNIVITSDGPTYSVQVEK